MAHTEQRNFMLEVKALFPEYFKNKIVLDVGSLNINGCNKYLIEECNYIGIDVAEGPNVDIISIAHEYKGADNYFDTIISTECFEHDMYLNKTIKNIIRMLKPNGLFAFTCAGYNRGEHGTIHTDTYSSPLTTKIPIWNTFYKNLNEADFLAIEGFEQTFRQRVFKADCRPMEDLYFYGFKFSQPIL